MGLGTLRSLTRRLSRLATDEATERTALYFARWSGPGLAARYVREHLRRDLTERQEEILSLLDRPPYRVLARSANTQGKTFVAACKCSQFFDTARPSITLATAPTKKSVDDLLFKELRTIRPSSAGFLPKESRLQASPDHYVHGFTASKADAFHGRHAERLGLMFDEASGVDRVFWERGETMFESTGGHWWLCTYNPNDPTSPAFAAEESGGWHVVVLNALDHPNIYAELVGLPPPVPAAVRLETVLRRMAVECERVEPADPTVDFEFPVGSGQWWHPTTPQFESQVLGRWPVSPSNAVWSPVAFERCRQNARPLDPAVQVTIGCDVARYGDDSTCIAVRRGVSLVALETHHSLSADAVARRLRDVAGIHAGERGARAVPIIVDETGGYGAGVIDQAENAGYRFVGISASSQSPDPRFPNMRSHCWFALRQLADLDLLDFSRLSHGEAAELRAELTSARYCLDAKNRRVVEPKNQLKERLGRSPDLADAVALCYLIAALEA